MELREIGEGKARILVPDVERLKGPGRKHAGFYNPLMAFNRDVNVVVMDVLARRGAIKRALDGMAGTGVRGIRWALESPGFEIGINEPSRVANEIVRRNVELNRVSAPVLSAGIASAAMEFHADYVDIDPFGTPVPFFFPVVQNIRRGHVSVTATDTAALTGTIPRVTARRYHSAVARSSITHEIGLRTLVGALVRDAARVDREIAPLLGYYADHYYRIYFRVTRNAVGADRAIGDVRSLAWEGHQFGPLWCGRLCDPDLLTDLTRVEVQLGPAATGRVNDLLSVLMDESTVMRDGHPVIGFIRVDNLARETRTEPASPAALVATLRERGFKASRTHFDRSGVRTDARREEVARILKETRPPGAAGKSRDI